MGKNIASSGAAPSSKFPADKRSSRPKTGSECGFSEVVQWWLGRNLVAPVEGGVQQGHDYDDQGGDDGHRPNTSADDHRYSWMRNAVRSGGSTAVEAPGRVELPTNGLGNRCSIHLSYGASFLISLAALAEPAPDRRPKGASSLSFALFAKGAGDLTSGRRVRRVKSPTRPQKREEWGHLFSDPYCVPPPFLAASLLRRSLTFSSALPS